MREFTSINASIGWLGITSSPLCSFFLSRYLQKNNYSQQVSEIFSQFSSLKILKKHGKMSYCPLPGEFSERTIVEFSVERNSSESIKLCYII